MYKSVLKMEDILSREQSVYEEIYMLEERKSEAIIARKGEVIQELSEKQESLIRQIEVLEEDRSRAIVEYKKENNLDDLGRTLSLNDIISSMDEDSAHHLLIKGLDLKNTLFKVQMKQETNQRLLEDNMEFFNILISGLKSSSSLKSGYDRDGRERERTVNPVLFNKRA